MIAHFLGAWWLLAHQCSTRHLQIRTFVVSISGHEEKLLLESDVCLNASHTLSKIFGGNDSYRVHFTVAGDSKSSASSTSGNERVINLTFMPSNWQSLAPSLLIASDALRSGVFSSRAWPWYDTMHAAVNFKTQEYMSKLFLKRCAILPIV